MLFVVLSGEGISCLILKGEYGSKVSEQRVDRVSRYKFLLITKLTHFFMYLFISSLYMFRASQCSSSGGRIVLIHHLV